MTLGSSQAPHPDDTIAALSSAVGPAYRAIVRISGPQTSHIIQRIFRAIEHHPTTTFSRNLIPGHVHLSGVHSPLPADLYFFSKPNSYTGQDLAELHTISSPPLLERLLADVGNFGARPARPGELTLRAFLAGKLDLAQAEAVHALIEARSEEDLRRALSQLAGGLSRPLDRLRNELLNLLADLEAELDFVDEDITFVQHSELEHRLAVAINELEAIQRQLEERSISGRPFRVVLVGKPNAGKSSLFNALAPGPTALVSPMAGTTRDYLTKRLTLGGVLVELIDTAGWQNTTHVIDAQAQALACEQAETADLILWCVETGDQSELPPPIDFKDKLIRIRTKSDLAIWQSIEGQTSAATNEISTSVTIPQGIVELTQEITKRALEFSRPAGVPSESRCRHHLVACQAELREALKLAIAHEPRELMALCLRSALNQLAEIVGAIYTNDLLDRIFSRFCIGK